MRKIKVTDYSIRSLTENGSLLFREKAMIAAALDGLGIQAIELPPVTSPKEDAIVYKTISSSVQNCEICLPVGFDETGVEEIYACIKDAKSPCLVVEVPVSTVTMEYTYHIKADKMIAKVQALCKAASALCKNVQFSALDATRADIDDLIRIISAAAEAGATSVCICDDAGVLLPRDVEATVKTIKEKCPLPLYVKVSDALHLANANALFALMAGADGVKCAISGENNLKISEIAKIIDVEKEKLDLCSDLKVNELKSDIAELKKSSVRDKLPEKTTGGAADVCLDGESNISDVQSAAVKLGYELSPEDAGKVYKALGVVLQKKTSVGAKEFEAIIASNAASAPSTYHLDSFNITSSNLLSSMANIVLLKGEEKLIGVALGDGPIDAAFFAVEQCIGHHYELDSFEIQAVTEGKEALGSTIVKLRSEGKLYSGVGLSTDIVGASIRAYINALNKIVYEEGLA